MTNLTADELRKKMAEVKEIEAKRVANNARARKELETLLKSLPKVNHQVIPDVVKALLEAADDYMASYPLIDTNGRRSKSGIADARASVAALHKALTAARKELENLPLPALSELTNAYDAPMGRLKADVAQVCTATETALKALKAQPDKAPDVARTALAHQVAVVFRDILKLKPSTTSDKSLNVTMKRGGAAYARVLRAALKAAGVNDYDPEPLIKAGLRLLNDPALP